MNEWLETFSVVLILPLIAVAAHLVTRVIFLRILARFSNVLPGGVGEVVVRHHVLSRLAYIVPLQVLHFGMKYFPGTPDYLISIIVMLTHVSTFLVLGAVASAILNAVNEMYQRRPYAASRPVKGYLQFVKILMFTVIFLLIVSTLLDRDIFALLAGLGAVMAVILLIFQSTILSLVASIQVSSCDMVRIGDWIEMPALNADGDVIDISLHTMKVRNWDKTVTTIPMNRLLNETFKNWRGMQEIGGRRIKRALMIDQTSVRFLSDEEREHLRNFFLIDDYLKQKEQELEDWNRKLEEHGRKPLNYRRLTNFGTFRAYVIQYLANHAGLNRNLTTLVRQMDPTPEGLPLEIWCFTSTTEWKVYEATQADIFDHLLSILPEFGLRIFQHPSGHDFNAALLRGAQPELTR